MEFTNNTPNPLYSVLFPNLNTDYVSIATYNEEDY